MASTSFRCMAFPGLSSIKVYFSSVGGTGTPNGSGYSMSQEFGAWYKATSNITEALVGRFLYRVEDSTSSVIASGITILADDTGTYYGLDPNDHGDGYSKIDALVVTGLNSNGFTSTRGSKLDNLDATVSSRESESSASTRASTEQTEHDATQSAIAAINVSSQVQSAMTSQGYTTTRAPKLDNLDATVSSRESESSASTRATTDQSEHDATQAAIAAIDFEAAATAALEAQGYTSARAGNLDNLDATISSRESESSASTRASTDQSEHDATQAAIAGLTVSVDYDAVSEAVWDSLTADLTTSGSIGKLLIDRIDAAISSRLSTTDASTNQTALLAQHTATQDLIDTLDAAVESHVQAALDTQGLTTTRAAKLDNLDVAVSTRESESSASTRASTNQSEHDATQSAIAGLDFETPVENVFTDLGYTNTRAIKLDNLDNLTAVPPTVDEIADEVETRLSPDIIIARDQATIAANNTQT